VINEDIGKVKINNLIRLCDERGVTLLLQSYSKLDAMKDTFAFLTKTGKYVFNTGASVVMEE
jgi:hypothetical protein